MAGNGICSAEGCSTEVSKPGYPFCREHWKAAQAKGTSTAMTSTVLGEHLGLSPQQMNIVLSELGWIEKSKKGWIASEQGVRLHAEAKIYSNGIPYVVWPEAILASRILRRAVADSLAPPTQEKVAAEEPAPYKDTFRKRFPPTHRASDGHWVRSKAEMIIDDWLYAQARLPHAYERRVPIEEDMYCDFYLPQGKVYIEYWGRENDPQYLARKDEKVALYKANDLNLIELTDDHVTNLDDHFPRLLRKFGIIVD